MSLKQRRIAVWVAAALGTAAAGATVMHMAGIQPSRIVSSAQRAIAVSQPVTQAAGSVNDSMETRRDPYIIVFGEAPLATYRGQTQGYAAPSTLTTGPARGRLDVHSAAATRYVRYLQGVQGGHEADIARAIGRPLRVRDRMQHALNAIIVELTPAEAEKVKAQRVAQIVEKYQEMQIDTDVGPRLIGAETLWLGQAPGFPTQYQGEGTVIADIDTGINFGSPSFAAVGPVDGYQHINPLGAGHYLGTCAPGGVDAGRCNDKLIGGYDFVCDEMANATQTFCQATASYREEPGFGDTNSHGSHTASTAVGNRRDVNYKGATLRISGVAPHANIIAYDVCYTNLSTGGGSCPNTSSVKAVNQAVADGVVNVINFSIGGGIDPWTDAVSQAFLNASDAGIYVATSAGNSGPGPNTMGHHEPWTASTAAAQHGRGDFAYQLSATSPTPVPASMQGINLTEGSGGVSMTQTFPATTPLKISAGIDTTSDACSALPAGSLNGAIAVVRRGTCSFSIKVNNAAAAGAVAVIIANNQAGTLAPSVPGTTVPAFSVTQVVGDSIRNFGVANPSATATIPVAPVALSNTPDQLADFSSRGPAGTYDLLKPDLTAPGVNILATIAGTTVTGSENAVGLLSGTSMASPHNAGAALLIHQAQPTWKPAEIRSALAMTAKQTVLMEDGVTQANPFARGAGRIQVDQAIRAGLVLNETKANYVAANPATGGNPMALNQPSLINGSCFERCVFTRTFRNTLSFRQAWSVKVEGLSATVSPALFTVNPGESKAVTFTINSYQLPANSQFNFGTVVLTPQSAGNPNQPVLRMPVAIAVKPAIASAPASVNATVAAGATGTATFSLGNLGGSRMTFAVDNTGTGVANIVKALSTGVTSGFRSTRFTDPATAGNNGQYSADDFTLDSTTRITSLTADGFVVSGSALTSVASQITWTIYSDASNLPAGYPNTNPTGAVWTYSSSPLGAGVTTANGTIGLNLSAAGQTVNLPPGKYWFVVNTQSTFANRWAWYGSNTGSGSFASITVSGTPAWAANSAFAGLSWQADGAVACGAPWIGAATPPNGTLSQGTSTNVQLQLNAAGMSAGNYIGYACVSTSDPARPKLAVRVALTITP
ncbi:S8 family serine peptidase [Cognatilysobacter terrigena]|uniref:S8 family serine peptidase n=1 Tax=Cognatilysobacter terrigena TaxID=2488749 RepID=UPI00105FF614|nr:S8 family serine peptidase [Lysobacter terrigena]